jgi:hypothetical protein
LAELVAVLARSGMGKSTSIGRIDELGIKGLPPEHTAIINVKGKNLPFPGWKEAYNTEKKNYIATRDIDAVQKYLKFFGSKPEVTNIVIDDFQYIMSGKYMDDSNRKGFEKFTELGKGIWDILEAARGLREDVKVYVLSHIEEVGGEFGSKSYKLKTIGKLLDEKVDLEGLFTIVLYAEGEISDNKVKRWFRTQSNGNDTAKSPYGMFPALNIPNDLGYVSECIDKFNNG